MSTGKSTGANPHPNGNTAHHTHHDGSSGRAFTVEQKEAVVRIRKCSPTAFYDILGLELEKKTVTDAGIKKAYRKLSLLTHPDKNGYTGADEAFKMVSRAFQILSDPDKKSRFDQFGGDPDNRFSSASGSSPFSSGFARSPGGGMRPGSGFAFEEEMTPEELFRQFFGGGFGGGPFGGPLGGFGGPGFVFNVGGGPGIRVHQFGGTRPRRRPPGSAQGAQTQQEPPTAWAALQNLLPLLIFFVIPLLSSLLSGGSSTSKLPSFHLDTPEPPQTQLRTSPRHKVEYYINPQDVAEWQPRDRRWSELDRAAENRLIWTLDIGCDQELRERQDLLRRAQGWFGVDRDLYDRARNLEMQHCKRLEVMGVRR